MATSVKQTDFVKTAMRLPPTLHARVHELAQESGRSFNAEVIHLIERAADLDAFAQTTPTEEVVALREGSIALGALTRALAAALVELAPYAPPPNKTKYDPNARALEMAAAILQGGNIFAAHKHFVIARREGSDKVVHIDLERPAPAFVSEDPPPPRKRKP